MQILCDVCESPFTTKSALTRHKKLKHSKIVKKFMCPICEQLFENRSNFKQHHQRKHADVVQPNEPAVVMVEAQEKGCRICLLKICRLYSLIFFLFSQPKDETNTKIKRRIANITITSVIINLFHIQ